MKVVHLEPQQVAHVRHLSKSEGSAITLADRLAQHHGQPILCVDRKGHFVAKGRFSAQAARVEILTRFIYGLGVS